MGQRKKRIISHERVHLYCKIKSTENLAVFAQLYGTYFEVRQILKNLNQYMPVQALVNYTRNVFDRR